MAVATGIALVLVLAGASAGAMATTATMATTIAAATAMEVAAAMYIAMTTAIAVAPAQATATAKASDSATGMTFHGAQSMIEEALLSFGNGFGDGFISYGHVDSGQGFSFCEPEGRGYGCGPHYGYMMLSGQGCGLGSAYNLQGAINTNGGLGHGDYLGFAWTIF